MKINTKGFTLVEMAVVLVIIGLVLGAILGVATTQIQSARISSTKQKEEAIKLALISFIAKNSRLPCPAVATLISTDAGYGVEATPQGTCTGTNVNGTVASGIVPWSSLGISEEIASDGYYNRFTYQVTLEATSRNPQTISGLRGDISIHYATPIAMGAPGTGNQANVCAAAGAYNPCNDVVVIISHGANGLGAYSPEGTRHSLPDATSTDEFENTNDDNHFVMKDFSSNTANSFDDIILPLSSTELLTPLTSHGSLVDYTAKINSDFSDIKNAIIASAIRNKSNPTAPFSYPILANLNTLPLNTRTDPWGNLYSYIQILPTINRDNFPIDAVFQLNSNGPDGVVGGGDDISYIGYFNSFQDAVNKEGG